MYAVDLIICRSTYWLETANKVLLNIILFERDSFMWCILQVAEWNWKKSTWININVEYVWLIPAFWVEDWTIKQEIDN